MDKNNIIGFVLIAAVLIGFGIWSQPSAEQRAEQNRQDSIARVEAMNAEKAEKLAAQKKETAAKAKATADTTALFHAALSGKATNVVLKNGKVELAISTKGGTVNKAVIKDFDDYRGNNSITLFDAKTQSLNFALLAKEANINTSDLYFTPSAVSDSTLLLTADAGNGKSLAIKYVLGNDYMLHMSIQANGLEGYFAPSYNQMDVQWNDLCRQQERGFTFENRYASLTYHLTDGGTEYLSETSEQKDKTG